MKTILYFHHSADLYGSDKTLLQLVIGMKKNGYNPIVIIPNSGPLENEFITNGIEYFVSPVLKLSRDMFSFRNLFLWISSIYPSFIKIKRIVKNQEIDFIHSNTLAVLLGALYAKRYRIKHIWHVHEIIEKPRLIHYFYRILLQLFSDKIIYNSNASQKCFSQGNKIIKRKSAVIHNGIVRPIKLPSKEEIIRFKSDILKINNDSITIGVVGRINKWKGQILLLDTFEKLSKNYPKINLLIVGSPPAGQEIYLTQLQEQIKLKGLTDKVQIIPFQKNISKVWLCIDIAVVPSILPEPFGLVAVEAMHLEIPVLASNHGGLQEIISDNTSGLFFEPNEGIDLYNKLELLISNSKLREKLAKNGKLSVSKRFTVEKYVSDFANLYLSLSK